MIDEDDASNSDYKHVPAATILEIEEIVDNDGRERKRSTWSLLRTWSKLSPHQLQICPMTRK
jgi:hypothetical protein